MSKQIQNPYSSLDPTSQLTWWNKFTDALGFTNHASQLQYQNQLNANLWDSQYQLDLEDRRYNSEVEQSRRMRDAGLNPDLLGVGSGASALGSNSLNTPNNNPHDFASSSFSAFLSRSFEIALSVASGVNNLFTSDMASMSSVLSSNKSDLVGNALGFSGQKGFLDALLNGSFQGSSFSSFVGMSPDNVDEVFKLMFPNSFRTRRANKIAERYLKNYISSDAFRNDVMKSFSESKSESVDALKGDSTFSALAEHSPNADFTEVSKILAKYQLETLKNDAKSSKLRSEGNLSVQERLSNDPNYYKNVSNANIYGAQDSSESAQTSVSINSVERDLIKELSASAKKGNVIASAILLFYGSFKDSATNKIEDILK